jgi:hypothetical protein
MLDGYKAKLIMMMFKTFHHHWSKWFSCPIHLQPFMLYKRCPHTSQLVLGSQKCTRNTSNVWQLNFALHIHRLCTNTRKKLYPLYTQHLQTKWDGQIYMYKVDLKKKHARHLWIYVCQISAINLHKYIWQAWSFIKKKVGTNFSSVQWSHLKFCPSSPGQRRITLGKA